MASAVASAARGEIGGVDLRILAHVDLGGRFRYGNRHKKGQVFQAADNIVHRALLLGCLDLEAAHDVEILEIALREIVLAVPVASIVTWPPSMTVFFVSPILTSASTLSMLAKPVVKCALSSRALIVMLPLEIDPMASRVALSILMV